MKKILIALIITTPLISSAQWLEKSTSEAGFYNLTVLNEDTLFVCDSYTAGLLRSVDGGVTWNTIELPNAWDFKIQFLNDSIGFAGGIADFITGPTYFKTTDCGQTWDTLSFRSGGGIPYHSLFFITKDIGFVSNAGAVYKTVDGGTTFHNVAFPISTFFMVGDIKFVNDTTGFVTLTRQESSFVFINMIYKTENQGISWTEVYNETFNWDTALVGNNYPMFRDIYFSDENEGYFTGIAGKILKTTDRGISWSLMNTPIEDHIVADLSFLNVDTGYMVTGNKLYKTLNKGLDWGMVTTPADSLLRNVHFMNTDIGFVAGKKLYKTESSMSIPNAKPTLKSTFKIFPNPTNEIIRLSHENNLEIQSIQLVDMSGKLIRTFHKDEKELNINGITKGIYLMNIQTKESSLSEKIIIN